MKRPAALLAATILLATTVLALAGCGASTEARVGNHYGWAFTDDSGKTITLDHLPTKVAGLTDALIPLMRDGIMPVAAFGRSSVDTDPRFQDFDVSGIATLGSTYGEIDEKKLIAAAPDVIVTTVNATDESQPRAGFADLEQQARIEKIAPVVAIRPANNGPDDATTRLAALLGASRATRDE